MSLFGCANDGHVNLVVRAIAGTAWQVRVPSPLGAKASDLAQAGCLKVEWPTLNYKLKILYTAQPYDGSMDCLRNNNLKVNQTHWNLALSDIWQHPRKIMQCHRIRLVFKILKV